MRMIASVLFLLCLAPVAATEEAFEPARTHALIVGVLRWKDSSITSFGAEKRQDRVLLETLVARGVKRERTRLLLDEEATRSNVLGALREILKGVGPGDTLIVYYAGHGTVVDDSTITFLEYDYDGTAPKTSGLSVPLLTKLLASGFRGRNLLLLADCCHSGGMARVAAGVAKGKVRAASLTSAADSNASTGNWTFTLTLLDGLRGEAIADGDGDGAVSLGELAAEVRDAMKYRERQRHGFALHGISPGYRMARAGRRGEARPLPKPYHRKQYVRVLEEGTPRVGRILGERGGEYEIQLQGYVEREIVRRRREKIEPITFTRYEKGAEIEVLWGKRLWKAKVVRRDGDFHWITYPGWPPVWDEWVLDDRIRPPGQTEEQARERARCGGRYAKLLKVIEVPGDLERYGLFCEEGYFEIDDWGGHTGLPAGHWVYVYPRWFIWGDRR